MQVFSSAAFAGYLGCAAVLASCPAARAQYVVTMQQVGANVVATGSGSIDLTGLSLYGTWSGPASVGSTMVDGFPVNAVLTGAEISGVAYDGFTGPFGFDSTMSDFVASSSSGDSVGIDVISGFGPGGVLLLPDNYVSGAALNSSSTWDDETIASLDLVPGSYEWVWGSNGVGGSLTLDIDAPPIPEPGSLGLLAVMLAIGATVRHRRRAQKVRVLFSTKRTASSHS